MKKISLNKLENICGGAVKCGWVGMGTVASMAIFSTVPIVGALGLYALSDDVVRCWNS